MLDLYRMIRRTVSFYRNRWDGETTQWDKIRKRMLKKIGWNFLGQLTFVGIAAGWHFLVRPLPLESWGILLVGIGAVRLALVSARSHTREFDDSSHNAEAIQDRQMKLYRQRVAGNMVDALSGFALVAIGFTIRVGAEFL